MYYIYLLRSADGKFYIGYTHDLRRRISEHQAGKVYTTKRMDKTRLLYYEAYLDKESAREREMKLKRRSSSFYGLIKRLNLK
ncbi:GIY-YIG nuclease family protein [Patescibacteria group bacterium]|nr:GIY-YIG nuclease family protein [Patescibacteria group bacterium]